MRTEKFDFQNSQGETLSGRLAIPENPSAFAIFAHCFTCSKNVKAASRISNALASSGVAVLRFDFTGLGNSDGDFPNTNYSSNLSDIEFAAKALAEKYTAPELLVGHSLGGTACLHAASRIESVRAVCTIGSPAQPDHVTKLFGDRLQEIEAQGTVQVVLAGREFTIGNQFVEDIRQAALINELPKLGRATLIFHSPSDELVGIDQARLIYQGLQHPKSFISLDGADHMLSDTRDSMYVAESILAWVNRYLVSRTTSENVPNASIADDSRPQEHGQVFVRQQSGFTHNVHTPDHSIIADEPLTVGGANLGMTPYDLLLAALGTCTSMTLKIYADHKKLPLERVEVKLKHKKIHAEDCESCESESGKIDAIEKEIVVFGNLTQEQIVRLGEIADRCPVHRTLMGEKEISTKIKLSNP